MVHNDVVLNNRPNTFYGEKLIAKGYWGEWGPWFWAPDDHSLGCGVIVKAEDNPGYDPTGTNAVSIVYCDVLNWHHQVDGGYSGGEWGSWDRQLCPVNMYISALEMQVQSKAWGDDTAANQVRFMCRDMFRQTQSEWIYAGLTK